MSIMMQIFAGFGYVIYGALLYGALLAAAAYSRDWFGFRLLLLGAVLAWGSYAALLIVALRGGENAPAYMVSDDGKLTRLTKVVPPRWLVALDRTQRGVAIASIIVPVVYIVRVLVLR